jgi:hypothetical protein
MHDSQGQQHGRGSFSQGVNAIPAIAQYLSMIGTVFVRWPGTWGCRFAGLHMAVSWGVMFIFGPLFFPQADPMPMVYLWLGATGLLLLHRIACAQKNPRAHSLYGGWSILSMFTKDESLAKGLLEPMAFVLAACLVGQFSEPMAVYFIVVAVGLFITTGWSVQMENSRIQSAEDAWHDARYVQQQMEKRMEE